MRPRWEVPLERARDGHAVDSRRRRDSCRRLFDTLEFPRGECPNIRPEHRVIWHDVDLVAATQDGHGYRGFACSIGELPELKRYAGGFQRGIAAVLRFQPGV